MYMGEVWVPHDALPKMVCCFSRRLLLLQGFLVGWDRLRMCVRCMFLDPAPVNQPEPEPNHVIGNSGKMYRGFAIGPVSNTASSCIIQKCLESPRGGIEGIWL